MSERMRAKGATAADHLDQDDDVEESADAAQPDGDEDDDEVVIDEEGLVDELEGYETPYVEDDSSEQLTFEIPAAARTLAITYLAHADIEPDPDQPRAEPDAELRESIAREGVLEPIIVRQHPSDFTKHMIVDGERRWRGAAGVMDRLPCIVRDDRTDDAERLRTQLIANTGKPLTPIEEAIAYDRLLKARPGWTPARLARWLGRPASTVHQRLQVLNLGPWVDLVRKDIVPYTQLVDRVLVFAGCPREVHEAAVKSMEAHVIVAKDDEIDDAAETEAQVHASVIRFLPHLVRDVYEKALYPLTKTRNSFDRQPEFDISRHDAECECGRIGLAKYNGSTKRDYCGDPSWWKPRLRKAKAAAKPKQNAKAGAASSGAATASFGRDLVKELALPSTTPRKKVDDVYAAKNVTAILAASGGVVFHEHDERAYDPRDLGFVAQKDLVIIEQAASRYIGTTNTAAVEGARAKWRKRWTDRRAELTSAFEKKHGTAMKAFAIKGPGLRYVVETICDDDDPETLTESAIGKRMPTQWNKRKSFYDALTDAELERMTMWALWSGQKGRGVELPTDTLLSEQEKALTAAAAQPRALFGVVAAPTTSQPAKAPVKGKSPASKKVAAKKAPAKRAKAKKKARR